MKYFTRSWASGGSTPEESERARRAYWSRVESLAGRWPGAVAELATAVDLHDAIIRRVRIDRTAAEVRIGLR